MQGPEPALAPPVPTVADVSDACDDLGLDCVRTGLLRPMWTGCPRLSGPVATVTLRPAVTSDENPLPDLLAAMAELTGRILVLDVQGRTDVQCWGEVLTVSAQRFGIPGAIVHGAVRDVEALAERRFPTFASGVYPGRILGRLRLVGVGADALIDGGVVHDHDFVVAGADGAVFLPADQRAEVIRRADERARNERRDLDQLRAGGDPREIFGSR